MNTGFRTIPCPSCKGSLSRVLPVTCAGCGGKGTITVEAFFVAIGCIVRRGGETIARAVTKTMAKRIANALNKHKPNSEGV